MFFFYYQPLYDKSGRRFRSCCVIAHALLLRDWLAGVSLKMGDRFLEIPNAIPPQWFAQVLGDSQPYTSYVQTGAERWQNRLKHLHHTNTALRQSHIRLRIEDDRIADFTRIYDGTLRNHAGGASTNKHVTSKARIHPHKTDIGGGSTFRLLGLCVYIRFVSAVRMRSSQTMRNKTIL